MKKLYLYFYVLSLLYVPLNTVTGQYVDFVQITNDTYHQSRPVIDGNYIVYEDNRGGGLSDIYLYNRVTKAEVALTSDPAVESTHPDISGNRIVWSDNRSGDWEIYIYNTNTPHIDPQPLFVWEGDQIEPAIHGNVMVFSDEKPGPCSYNIYLYEFDSGVLTRLTDDTDGDQRNPDVYGNYVVWQDQRSGDWDIYMYTIPTRKETQLTDDPAYQSHPAIHGNRVVWQDYRNGNWDIYLHHITFGLGNAFYNFDWPVWSQSIGHFNSEDQMYPAIYGDYVVWEDYRSGDWDLYLYTFINDIGGWPSQILDEDFDQKNAAMFEEFVVFQDERDNDGGTDIWQWERPPGVDVSLVVEDDPDPVITGGDLSYYVYIKNTGRQDADDVVVTCTLPDGVDRRYITNSSGLGASILGNVVTCELGTMAPNDRDTIHIAVTPLDEAILSFRASVVTSDVDVNPDNNSQTISTEVIWALSDVIDIGMNPSLFMRGNASHIVYNSTVYTDHSPTYYLKYATNKTGVWSRSILLEDHDNPIVDAHVVVDQNDSAHVVFFNNGLYYIRQSQSGWSTPLKLAESYNFVGVSIGCSPDGIVYVSYLKSMWGDNINLHYFNGTWNDPVIIETTYPGRVYNDLAMSVDKDGYLHFAYYELPGGPNYITNAPDSVWKTPELIHNDWECGQCESLRLSIATDGNNHPHVGYSASYQGDYEENFMYAVKSSGSWSNEFIYDNRYSFFNAITTGILQEPHMCIGGLYGFKSGGGWGFETFTHSAHEIKSIKTDDEGYVHIAFSQYSSSYENDVVKYLTNRPEPPKPQISINPTGIDFWKFVVGDTTKARVVTIKNFGDADLVLSDVRIDSIFERDFVITENPCTTIPPGAYCEVMVAFAPQSIGNKTEYLVIESNDPVYPLKKVKLMGEGLEPIVGVTGDRQYGDVEVGESLAHTFEIANSGNMYLRVDMVILQDDDADQFSFDGLPDRPFLIDAGESEIFNVYFSPTSAGDKKTKLKVFTSDLDLMNIELTGTGVIPSHSISGSVKAPDGSAVTEGNVFVYEMTPGGEIDDLRYKPLQGSSDFNFINIPESTITLRIFPDPEVYPDLMNAYMGNSTTLNDATFFYHDNDTTGLELVTLNAPGAPGGSSDVDGVLDNEDSPSALPKWLKGTLATFVEDAAVYLNNQSGDIIGYDVTDVNGEFNFKDIPIGTFTFFADYMGIPMADAGQVEEIVITEGNQLMVVDATIENGMISVVVSEITKNNSIHSNSGFKVYPNPASDKVYIEAKQMIEDVTIKLINLEGQLLWEEVISGIATGLRAVVPVSFLNNGIYLIRIDGKKLNYETKIVIMK